MNKLALLCLPLAACIPSIRAAEEANQQRVARMCNDANYAYESGHNDGMRRRPLDTSWVDTSCMPHNATQIRDSYQAGYNTGIQNAPIVVEGRGFGGTRTSRRAASAPECTFSSDCGEGQSCRADITGTNVCMGYGYAGDACWFGSDCVSGSCNSAERACQ